jgi:hypothetical protein
MQYHILLIVLSFQSILEVNIGYVVEFKIKRMQVYRVPLLLNRKFESNRSKSVLKVQL